MAKRARKAAGKSRWREWTAAEARRVLKAWRASGLPLATFARKRGLCAERVRWWRQRLDDGHAPGEELLKLVPAVVAGLPPSKANTALTVRAGEVVVEIANVSAVPPAWVGTILDRKLEHRGTKGDRANRGLPIAVSAGAQAPPKADANG